MNRKITLSPISPLFCQIQPQRNKYILLISQSDPDVGEGGAVEDWGSQGLEMWDLSLCHFHCTRGEER